jgi:hypothetical protein
MFILSMPVLRRRAEGRCLGEKFATLVAGHEAFKWLPFPCSLVSPRDSSPGGGNFEGRVQFATP